MKSTIARLSLILALVAVVALASAPWAASPAAAKTVRTEIENWNINCSNDDSEARIWMSDDGIVHIRGRVIHGFVVSNSDYHTGTALNVANANIDPVTGQGTYHGTLLFHPDAYPDGYWVGHYAMQVTPSGASGIARLQGYGELDGLSTKSEITPVPPHILADFTDVCGGNPPVSGVHAEGFVMNPGDK